MDLCKAVPFFSMDESMRKRYWDDGLHLTMEGYDMMGNTIATKMLQLLESNGKPVDAGQKTRRGKHPRQAQQQPTGHSYT